MFCALDHLVDGFLTVLCYRAAFLDVNFEHRLQDDFQRIEIEKLVVDNQNLLIGEVFEDKRVSCDV